MNALTNLVLMLQGWWHKLYEGELHERLPALYRMNPCDAWAWRFLRNLGFWFEAISVQCPCCSGVRIVLAGALGAWFPRATAAALLVFLAGAVCYAIWATLRGKPESSR